MKKLKLKKQKMEGITNNKSKKFAGYITFLLQGFNKIKVINK
jgi:hypothetical protein